MTGLHISADLAELPLDAVTSTFAILAKRGSGKTYSASVLAEEMVGAGLRICVFDPVGAWWGIRSSADGERPGLPVIIIGGEYGDVELREDMGVELADQVVDGTFSCVIDTSLFETKASTIRFMLAFAKRLYHRNRLPLHLFLDEADMIAPQKPMGEDAALLGAMENIVRRGRQRGLGVTMITQRAAVLNKNVLTQIETLIVLRTTSPQDREAIDGWIEAQASREERKRVIDTLPSLRTGEAWVWSPSVLDVLARVQIRKRNTFDSGATPKVGETCIEPKQLAPVDIDAIRKALAPKVEAKKAAKGGAMDASLVEENLRLALRVQELEAREPERVEIPVLDDLGRAQIVGCLGALVDATRATAAAMKVIEAIGIRLEGEPAPVLFESPPCENFHPETLARAKPQTVHVVGHAADGREIVETDDRRYTLTRPAKQATPAKTSGAKLDAGARRILGALASFHPRRLTRAQAAALATLGAKGTTFRTYLSQLSTQALIERSGDELGLTPAGVRAAGDVEKPATTEQLVRTWSSTLDAGARRILDVLVAVHPRALTRDDVARRVGIDAGGTTFRTYLSQLSTRGLLDRQGQQLRASSSLFLGARS